MKKTVALHNLGCKVNAYELEAIQQLLENRGYEIVPFAPGADVYIINTCTVTNIADRKSRQMLHKAKKMNPDAVVVACGCYVQAAGEKLEEDTAIDLIIGNNKKKDLVDILENFLAEREDGGKPSDAECKSFLVDMTHNREYETLSISKTAEHTRAFLKVQDGCNQFCTYCIIPYARGRVRSRRQSDVVEEVKRLVEAGYQEVVLTGIHLSSYGLDFPEGEKETLLDLIRAVDACGRHQKNPSRIPGAGHHHRRVCRGDRRNAEGVPAFPSFAAERKQWNTEADEPEIYRRRIQTQMRSAA